MKSYLLYVFSLLFIVLYIFLYEHVRNYVSILGFSTSASYFICGAVFILAILVTLSALILTRKTHLKYISFILFAVLLGTGIWSFSGSYVQFPDRSVPAWKA